MCRHPKRTQKAYTASVELKTAVELKTVHSNASSPPHANISWWLYVLVDLSPYIQIRISLHVIILIVLLEYSIIVTYELAVQLCTLKYLVPIYTVISTKYY